MVPTSSARSSTPAHRPEGPPLTIPVELWGRMPEEQKRLFRDAQRVFDEIAPVEASTLATLTLQMTLGPEEILYALRALESMGLVTLGLEEQDVVIRMVAVPDEHVPVVGPDEQRRWIFVVRPLVAPEWDPATVN